MKVREKGCVICGATWGDYWEEVEGQRMFFCCDICAIQFKNMVNEVKSRTGWESIEEITMQGDYRGRKCIAISTSGSYKFFIRFNPEAEIESFAELDET